MANSFKALLSKTAQHSQLKTKFYGIVKGLFENFKGISDKKEDQNKKEFIVALARRIGSHLVNKLRKNIKKNMRSQLNDFEKQLEEENKPDDDIMASNELRDKNDYSPVKAYTELRSLAREEKITTNLLSQKFFDILVFFI